VGVIPSPETFNFDQDKRTRDQGTFTKSWCMIGVVSRLSPAMNAGPAAAQSGRLASITRWVSGVVTTDGTVNGITEGNITRERRGCRAFLLVLVLVFCGGCLLSILTHSIMDHLDVRARIVAEICIGETYEYGDPGPIKRQGVWVASPILPAYTGSPIRSLTINRFVCGIIPWSSKLPYFMMLVIRPFGMYVP